MDAPVQWKRWKSIVVGLAGGGAYAAVDGWLGTQEAQGLGGQAVIAAHYAVDHLVPVFLGVLLAVAVDSVRLRARLAYSEQERTAELQRRLQKVERDQAVWVVAAATLHEIRNPLHSLGLLLEEATSQPPPSDEERATLLQHARAQASRMDAHLAPLRDMAQGSGRDIRPLVVMPLVQAVVTEMAPLATEAHVDLTADGDAEAMARADPVQARIILEHLVNNALEALREHGTHGTIHLEVRQEGAHVMLRVTDSGPGLEEARAKALFEPLGSRKERGLGLGLSISRALARAMGGDLRLQETAPGRTVFCFQLNGAAA